METRKLPTPRVPNNLADQGNELRSSAKNPPMTAIAAVSTVTSHFPQSLISFIASKLLDVSDELLDASDIYTIPVSIDAYLLAGQP
jgi:hypothetical protein